MFKITNTQLYSLLVMLAISVAVLEQPHRLLHIAHNNAWLFFLLAVIPGTLLVLMYAQIIKKSSKPFPLLLDEHLGKFLGRPIGCLYIVVFLLICGFNLRLFIEFMKMIVLPATPISIFIGVILLIGYYAIKTGFESIARVFEIIVVIGIIFSVIITFTSLLTHFNTDRILPFAYMNLKTMGIGLFTATMVMAKIMPVLTLAFFLDDKKQSTKVMMAVLFTYVIVLALATFAVIVTVGSYPSMSYVFPTFSMVRLAYIGEFIQNLDIAFVAIWILGIFGAVTSSWFMACFTSQLVFNLKDHRFLAAPSSVIIGILSIIIGKSNLEVVIWSVNIIPWLFTLFFAVIPFLLFIICCFKPVPEAPANSQDPLHNAEAAG